VTPVAKQPSVCNSGAKFFFQSMTGGHSPMSLPLATPLKQFVYDNFGRPNLLK